MRLAVVVLAACSSHAPAKFENRAVPTLPLTAAPTVRWNGEALVTSRLPAVARDGDLVVIPVVENDSGRGYPNLRLELRTRADRTTRRLHVLGVDEYETLIPDGTTPNPTLGARIEAINRDLARLHSEHDLVEMRDAPGLMADAAIAPTKWPAPEGQRCAQCPPCSNPAFVRRVLRAEDVAVVVIGYRGDDTCWEPSDAPHVVTLPR